MKVLMFGWEYPPHVYGGLATANFGITQGLHAQGDIDITLCLPKPFGDEDHTAARIVAMNCVPIAWRNVDYDYVKSRIGNVMDPDYYYRLRDHLYADFNYMYVNELGCMDFAGGYPSNLHDEINNYSIIAGVVARTEDFDIIHAHDWLTYPAGIHAKRVSGKPLCIHVHATDFDRSRGNVNPTVYSIEKDGMDNADCIMCVSELTRQTVINQYHRGACTMILALNIGNSHITFGGYAADGKLVFSSRLFADSALSSDELLYKIVNMLALYGVEPHQITGVIFSSVVPTLTGRLREALCKMSEAPVMEVGPGLKSGG